MWNWLEKLSEIKSQGISCATALIVGTSGSTPREVGARMIILPDGTFFGTIGGGQLEIQVIMAGIQAIKEQKSVSIDYSLCSRTGQCCGGAVTVFIDIMVVKPRVYIFGAGHVGKALAKTLLGTPFEVHVIDSRDLFINSEELPDDIVKHKGEPIEVAKKLEWDERLSYGIILTHSHALDEDILKVLLRKPRAYLGLIGSQTKWAKFQQNLQKDGFNKEDLAAVTCPIGLPLGGGKAPQEIAISVAAELMQIYYRSRSQS